MLSMLQNPGGRESAPDPLRLVQAFVNTLDIENGVEELVSPLALEEALVAIGAMPDGEGPLHEADLHVALDTREALRSLALANSGVPLEPSAPPSLERAARAAHFTVAFDTTGRARLVPTASGLDGALGRVLAVVHEAMTDGTWARLKGCPRDVCHWVFYDRSRNGSGKWCAMSVCGNRTNTRAYRRRTGATLGGR
jgi:CGNR zinc finger/Putative stress-induced transcription regulator